MTLISSTKSKRGLFIFLEVTNISTWEILWVCCFLTKVGPMDGGCWRVLNILKYITCRHFSIRNNLHDCMRSLFLLRKSASMDKLPFSYITKFSAANSGTSPVSMLRDEWIWTIINNCSEGLVINEMGCDKFVLHLVAWLKKQKLWGAYGTNPSAAHWLECQYTFW